MDVARCKKSCAMSLVWRVGDATASMFLRDLGARGDCDFGELMRGRGGRFAWLVDGTMLGGERKVVVPKAVVDPATDAKGGQFCCFLLESKACAVWTRWAKPKPLKVFPFKAV